MFFGPRRKICQSRESRYFSAKTSCNISNDKIACPYCIFCLQPAHKTEKQACAEQYGYEIWKNIQDLPVQLSVEDVIKGIRAKEEGKAIEKTNSEAFSKSSMTALRLEAFEKEAAQNLKQAKQFLQRIAKDSNMVELEPHRLYYEIKNQGNGMLCIQPSSTAYFHYTITTFDFDKIVDTWAEGAPKKVFLDIALPAFSKGVVGMKQGERRIIYAHPDLAYRRLRPSIPPEIAVTIDVQVVEIP